MKPNFVKAVIFSVIALVIVGASFLFATRFIYRSKAGVSDVIVQLQPATITTTMNSTFSIAVWLQSDPSKVISGATVPIQYDTTKLQYVAPDTSDANCNAIDTQVSLTNNAGQIVWTKVTFKPDADLPKGLFCFGKLQFKLIASGSTNITYAANGTAQVVGPGGALNLMADAAHSTVVVSNLVGITETPPPSETCATNNDCADGMICNADGKCVIAGTTLTPTITPTKTPTPTTPAGGATSTPTPTTPPNAGTPVLQFKLKLQGVQAKPGDASEIPLRFTVVKKDGSFNKVFTDVIGLFNDEGNIVGSFNMVGVSAGSGYRILVKGPKHLQRKYCHLNPTATENGAYLCDESSFALSAGNNAANFLNVPLLVGDLPDQDGLLNAFDIAQMNLNLLVDTPAARGVADVNYDGTVNSTDFSLLIQSMQLKYDEEQ